ncbi:Ribonuclease [Thalictrum thalictroides]|uniref:Ribonuclease n=1 Tax=Thalictrum thalictroides TaxID=46969 RepID=A0A7J6XAB5_THATH|nr:Ribonuclease [Thalictrum thalictroides]
MKSSALVLIQIFAVQFLVLQCVSQDFDFFYFVLQWPGAYCDTKRSCCYPTTGKPESDFGIHGLWPNNNDGSYPSNCDSSSPFDGSEISDLKSKMQTEWPTLACPSGNGMSFWAHEWDKHGTCSESVLDQHGYFETALNLKQQVDLLGALNNAGIQPNGGFYSLNSISQAISKATGFTPGIECNVDENGNSQLYQVYLCVDNSASNLIKCPLLPRGKCSSRIEFPKF